MEFERRQDILEVAQTILERRVQGPDLKRGYEWCEHYLDEHAAEFEGLSAQNAASKVVGKWWEEETRK